MIDQGSRAELEERIGYTFQDAKLLENALIHTTYANEKGDDSLKSNERLEFLGDAVTGLEVALLVFEEGPDMSEGQMTKVRASLVCREGLAAVARGIALGKYLLLGVGAIRTGVRENDTVLENAFEALVAAVFLDGGPEAARGMIRKLFTDAVREKILVFADDRFDTDYKSRLQEEMQKKGAAEIRYELKGESGPPHDKMFYISVVCGKREYGFGAGKTKKLAENMAAKKALEELKCI